jgi:hypothetical protein
MVLLWPGEKVIHVNEHKRAHRKHIGLRYHKIRRCAKQKYKVMLKQIHATLI